MNRKKKMFLLFISCIILLIFVFLVIRFFLSNGTYRPNIILVILDTVRNDHTDLKFRTDLTPHLRTLADEGAVFPNTWANAPWTVPSHASIFTGLLPSQHGCTTKNFYLSPDHVTVAELLNDLDYETAGFFSNPWLGDTASGLMRGFQTKKEIRIGGLNRLTLGTGDQGGIRINRAIEEWLKSRTSQKPFFLFVNYLEAHLPYDPPRAYREKYLKDLDPEEKVGILWAHEFNAGLFGEKSVDWKKIRRLYAGDVNCSDRLLGSLMDMLKRYGIYNRAVIIVTSDHGEHLGEHGLIEHQFSVYEPLLSVPLVIRAPDKIKGGIRLKPVMLSDLYATLIDFAGGEKNPDQVFSQSILETDSELEKQELPHVDKGTRYLISEYAGAPQGLIQLFKKLNPHLNTKPLENAYHTITDGIWRFTVSSDQKKILFNLREDPDQVIDFSSQFPGIKQNMVRLMRRIFSRIYTKKSQKKELDPETRKRLESLGYIQ